MYLSFSLGFSFPLSMLWSDFGVLAFFHLVCNCSIFFGISFRVLVLSNSFPFTAARVTVIKYKSVHILYLLRNLQMHININLSVPFHLHLSARVLILVLPFICNMTFGKITEPGFSHILSAW